MTRFDSPRRHLLLPWTVQEREDPVLERRTKPKLRPRPRGTR